MLTAAEKRNITITIITTITIEYKMHNERSLRSDYFRIGE